MKPENVKNLPRLYVNQPLGQGLGVMLAADHCHYLRNVLRKAAGDVLRLFNGQDGEWLYRIEKLDKKHGHTAPDRVLRPQPARAPKLALFFAPLKKNQTDFVVQKSTELGVTDLYPVLTDYSNTREVREERWLATAVEAAEQCERLDLPHIHPVAPLRAVLESCDMPLYVALERQPVSKAPAISAGADYGFVVGPEGGFSESEFDYFINDPDRFIPLSLGANILRAETAAVVGLGLISFSQQMT